MPAQVKLLRVLQQQEIERVGGTRSILVSVRIISATHQNLEKMVRDGKFREDLWFRLNVFPIIIPPLRQRLVDIPALVQHFLERKSMELKIKELPFLAPGCTQTLKNYDWPGNVRELENLVERALILHQMMGGQSLLNFDSLLKTTAHTYNTIVEKGGNELRPLYQVMAEYIERALYHTNGKVEGINGAAKLLGLHPSTLRGRMKKLGIPYGRYSQYNQ